MKLSVIIPALNEENVLGGTLQKVLAYLKKRNFSSQVIVVDDGSFDNTAIIAKSFAPDVFLLQNERTLGKGASVKKGMLAVEAGAALFMDADYSTVIEELDNLFKALENGYDIVIGSRAKKGAVILPQSWHKSFAGKIGNLIIRALAVPGIKDTQCGFKLFSERAVHLFQKQTLNGFGFDFEILFLARKSNYRIAELPVKWTNRKESRVKLKHYIITLFDLIKIRYQDLKRKYV